MASLSDSFTYMRIRQGYLLSMLLYINAAEVLAKFSLMLIKGLQEYKSETMSLN